MVFISTFENDIYNRLKWCYFPSLHYNTSHTKLYLNRIAAAAVAADDDDDTDVDDENDDDDDDDDG